MDDVTNYMTNIGKPLDEQVYAIQVTHAELAAIKALAQNPHPSYMDNPDMRTLSEAIFNGSSVILSYAQEREVRFSETTKLDEL